MCMFMEFLYFLIVGVWLKACNSKLGSPCDTKNDCTLDNNNSGSSCDVVCLQGVCYLKTHYGGMALKW